MRFFDVIDGRGLRREHFALRQVRRFLVVIVHVERARRRDLAFAFNAGEFDLVKCRTGWLVLFPFRRSFFLGVGNRLLAATNPKRIRLGSAMTDSAKIDSTAYAKTAAVVMTVTIVMFSAAAFTSPAAASARRTFTRTARAGSSFGECNSRKKKNARSDENRNESARIHCASDVSGRVNACPPGITIWSRLSAVNASFGQSTFV